jgi:predicted GNAT family N-acyltransferase
VNRPARQSYIFEPLGDHDRASFSCGVPDLDRYFRDQASQDAKRKVAAPFVMVDSTRAVAGYYTLSAYGIRLAEVPQELAKKLPKYPLLPGTLLGRLAVSQAHRGQKLGRLLLMDALHRSLRNTVEVALIGVVAEAYDEAAREFYLHHEFVPIAEHPKKVFIAMKTIEKAFA